MPKGAVTARNEQYTCYTTMHSTTPGRAGHGIEPRPAACAMHKQCMPHNALHNARACRSWHRTKTGSVCYAQAMYAISTKVAKGKQQGSTAIVATTMHSTTPRRAGHGIEPRPAACAMHKQCMPHNAQPIAKACRSWHRTKTGSVCYAQATHTTPTLDYKKKGRFFFFLAVGRWRCLPACPLRAIGGPRSTPSRCANALRLVAPPQTPPNIENKTSNYNSIDSKLYWVFLFVVVLSVCVVVWVVSWCRLPFLGCALLCGLPQMLRTFPKKVGSAKGFGKVRLFWVWSFCCGVCLGAFVSPAFFGLCSAVRLPADAAHIPKKSWLCQGFRESSSFLGLVASGFVRCWRSCELGFCCLFRGGYSCGLCFAWRAAFRLRGRSLPCLAVVPRRSGLWGVRGSHAAPWHPAVPRCLSDNAR